MTTDEAGLRRELATVEDYLARLREAATIAEGERDRLVMALADNTGCQDRRPTAVR